MGTLISSLKRRPRNVVPLPVEVYGRIFEFVQNPHDLLSLCLVSRSFHQEAERVLYSSVNLSDDYPLINTWFEKVSSTPRLAVLVHTVSFALSYAHLPSNPTTWLEIIRNGLHALVNLKELNLSRTSHRFIPSDHAWILANHAFRLVTFRNDMFDFPSMLPFLATQPELTAWHQSGTPSCQLPEGILPRLTDVSLNSSFLSKLTPRPITRISTKIQLEDADAELQFIDMLGIYGRRLRRLELERVVTEGCLLTADFIRLLAFKMPLIECLSLRDNGQLTSDSTAHDIAMALSGFAKLTTLSLFPDRALNPNSLYLDVLTPKKRYRAVSQFFRASSSLTRVALPTVHIDLVWHARSHRHSMIGDHVVG